MCNYEISCLGQGPSSMVSLLLMRKITLYKPLGILPLPLFRWNWNKQQKSLFPVCICLFTWYFPHTFHQQLKEPASHEFRKSLRSLLSDHTGDCRAVLPPVIYVHLLNYFESLGFTSATSHQVRPTCLEWPGCTWAPSLRDLLYHLIWSLPLAINTWYNMHSLHWRQIFTQ